MADYNRIETIVKQLDVLENRIQDLETSDRLLYSGIGAGGINVYNNGSIRVLDGGSVNIQNGGSLEVYGTASDPSVVSIGSGGKVVSDGPVSFKGASTFGGNSSVTGNLTVTGNVTIKSGLIKGNALKNQMSSVRNTQTSSNFSLSTAYADKVSASVTAPSWASSAIIYSSGTIEADLNGTSFVSYARMRIQSSYSVGLVVPPLGSWDSWVGRTLSNAGVVSNPGTITVGVQMRGNSTHSASTRNKASVSLIAVFYR